ncbi:MAG: NRDE family protein [Armatimonadetes bacterium]|nr:NRDE family protein [Armatimonadota bacterium]
MCLALIALDTHPRYPLIIAANRDEFLARPTAPAAFWADAPDIFGGRDLQSGGNWLAASRNGCHLTAPGHAVSASDTLPCAVSVPDTLLCAVSVPDTLLCAVSVAHAVGARASSAPRRQTWPPSRISTPSPGGDQPGPRAGVADGERYEKR